MKTYATLGPACCEKEIIAEMLCDGLTGFRLNLSHTTLPQCADWINALHEAEMSCGKKAELIIDMRGGEIRIGALPHPLSLQAGDTVVLGGDIPVDDDIISALKPGLSLLLDDGAIELAVLSADGTCRVDRGGMLEGRKSLSGIDLIRPAVSVEDHDDMALARLYGVTGIMHPFVRSRDDLLQVRQAMAQHGLENFTLFAKIEDAQGLATLPEWLDLADVVTVARGDLGTNLPLWELPRAQKEIAAICNEADKPFLVVTQLLHTMIDHPAPTRAEVSDIYNACLDGASALMLTGETAQGAYGASAVRWLIKVAAEGEKDRR